jgi:hypothetical protein
MYLLTQVKFESQKPHPQPLSDGEGSIRPHFSLHRRGVGGEVLRH